MEIKTISPKDLEAHYLAASFPQNSSRPYVVINMVMSLDGSVTVVDPKTALPSERGLGSKLDQRLMRVHRFHADATLNGAETLRISGSGSEIGDSALNEKREELGKSTNPIACILTRKATNLPLEKSDPGSSFFYSKDFDAVVFTTDMAKKEDVEKIRSTGRSVEIIPSSADNVTKMLEILKSKYGVGLLLSEGGPSINGSLLKNGLVDEVFITMALKIVGGGKHPFELTEPLMRDSLVGTKLQSVFFVEATNEVYLRYSIVK